MKRRDGGRWGSRSRDEAYMSKASKRATRKGATFDMPCRIRLFHNLICAFVCMNELMNESQWESRVSE